MKARDNPLARRQVKTVDLDKLGARLWKTDSRTGLTSPRVLRRLFRRETAADWIGDLAPGLHLWGFSKGQFSLVDIIRHLLAQLEDRLEELSLSTWTIAKADLGELEELLSAKRIGRLRFLLDFSFQRRQPALIAHIRRTFGEDALRITRNHAKFMLALGTREWHHSGNIDPHTYRLVVRTSMNLNFNPRLEDMEILDDPELYQFLDSILADVWSAHDARKQIGQKIKEYAQDFAAFEGSPEA